MKTKHIKFTKSFFDKQLKKGSLFILEKYLDRLPEDWMDCVSFIMWQGIEQNPDKHLLILDEKQSLRLFEGVAKDEIELFVIQKNTEINKIWNLLLKKVKPEEVEDPVRIFIGGENLREFCDKRNIAYRSYITEKDLLMSATAMKFEKHPDEDCRKPWNKDNAA